jgi:hypothetical protein
MQTTVTRLAPLNPANHYWAVDDRSLVETHIDNVRLQIDATWYSHDYTQILRTESRAFPWFDIAPKPITSFGEVDYLDGCTYEYIRWQSPDGNTLFGDMTNEVGAREVFSVFTAVPEPSPLHLMGIGVAILLIAFFSGAIYGSGSKK